MEETLNSSRESVSTENPIRITLEQGSRKSSNEYSPQTHLGTFDGSFNEKKDSSERTYIGGVKEELDQRPENLYFFFDKPYRLQKKWVLFAMTCLSFAIIGLNDSAVGALMPQMEVFYNKVSQSLDPVPNLTVSPE